MINLIKKGNSYSGPFPYFYETSSSSGGMHYQVVDLEKVCYVNNIVSWGLKLYNQNYLTISGSNDGTTWTQIARAQGKGNNTNYCVVRGGNVYYRYIRMAYNPIDGTTCTVGMSFSYE